MSLHFLIDGYNVLYAMPEMPSGTWEQKRLALLEFIHQQRPQGKNRLTVVFDSRQGMGDQLQHGGSMVVFTAGETADERLSNMVRDAENPREIVVVSNDKGVRSLVQGTGARWLSATDFLRAARGAMSGPRRQAPREPADSDAITDELKSKWL